MPLSLMFVEVKDASAGSAFSFAVHVYSDLQKCVPMAKALLVGPLQRALEERAKC